ncbi:M48 family metalloprotease [Nocardia fusca]|uniref:M48 family metalloprotease n=1 Tax=Nocardia fusca TaxID=941183 RepID=A0ABV3F4X8_9NOCA
MAAETGTNAVPVQARAFTAGTAIRFALLLAFVVVDSLSLLSAVTSQLRSHDQSWYGLCRLAVGYDPWQSSYIPAAALTHAEFIRSCEDSHGVARAPVEWMIAGSVAVLLVAAVIYLGSPVWRGRPGRLLPVDTSGPDELAARLRELVAVADLRRTPEFVIDPRAETVGAVVFGRLGRYTVCLDGGLVARSGSAPEVLRDVVLHELAHLRNRDVDITYATVALWRAFLVCALVPYLIGQGISVAADPELWWAEWQVSLRGILRVAVLVALTYLVRADILRTREVHADLEAAHRAGADAFAWQDDGTAPKHPRWDRFLGLWRTHPGRPERLGALHGSGSLFGVTALMMFLTGVTAQVANLAVPLAADGFGVAVNTGLGGLLSTWVTAGLVVGIAGYALWRAVGHAVVTGVPVPSGRRAGIWLGAGMAVGELMSFRSAGPRLLPEDPAILLVFVLAGAVFTWWLTHCAELWIRGCRGHSIRTVRLLGLGAALVVFGTWYGYWMSGPFLFLRGPLHSAELSLPGLPLWYGFIADLANRPLVLIGATCLWVFPLLALVRRPPSRTPAWIERMGGGDLGERALSLAAVSLRPAVVGAVLGGLPAGGAVALVMYRLHPGRPAGGLTPEFINAYPMWLTAGLGTAAVLTAGAVAAVAGRYRSVMAPAAAAGAGLFGLLGLFFFAATDGCLESMQVMAYTCAWRPDAARLMVLLQVPFVLGIGIHLAAAAALIAALAADGVRRIAARHRTTPPPDTVNSRKPGSLSRRRALVAVVSAVAIALVIDTGLNYYNRADVEGVAGSVGYEPARTEETTARFVQSWWHVGGDAKVSALHASFGRMKAAVTDALRASEAAGLPTVPLERAVFVPVCTEMIRVAADAAAFVPIPDERAQTDWAAALAATARAGADCRDSFENDGGNSRFDASMAESSAAVTAYNSLVQRLEALGAQANEG